jgi:hypothetical protein
MVRACSTRARICADDSAVGFRIGDRDYMVEEIVEQWYGPDASYYKVRADDDNVYLLRHDTSANTWSMESIQKPR